MAGLFIERREVVKLLPAVAEKDFAALLRDFFEGLQAVDGESRAEDCDLRGCRSRPIVAIRHPCRVSTTVWGRSAIGSLIPIVSMATPVPPRYAAQLRGIGRHMGLLVVRIRQGGRGRRAATGFWGRTRAVARADARRRHQDSRYYRRSW